MMAKKRPKLNRGEKLVRMPVPPRAQEAALVRFCEFIVRQVFNRWRNNVFSLTKSEIAKFADSEAAAKMLTLTDDNWAVEAQKKAAKVKRRILAQLSDERIQETITEILQKADLYNKATFYRSVSPALGIDTKSLIKADGATWEINALINETVMWIQSLRDKALQESLEHTLRLMAEGRDLAYIETTYSVLEAKRLRNASTLARNQIGNFNGLANKLRQQRLGIEEAIWSTSGDDTVRPSHADRDGKRYRLDEGCYSSVDGEYLYPGLDFNCRCDSYAVIPE